MQLFQDNDLELLGVIALTLVSLGIVTSIFLSPIGERVYIDKDLNISTDTIIQENSRWFYTSDSTQKDIILSVYRDKTGRPYEEIHMQPDDYVDLDLKKQEYISNSKSNFNHFSSIQILCDRNIQILNTFKFDSDIFAVRKDFFSKFRIS